MDRAEEDRYLMEEPTSLEESNVLYSTHVVNRSSVPVRVHAVYKTTLGTSNDIEGTREDSQEYLVWLYVISSHHRLSINLNIVYIYISKDPGMECTFEERFQRAPSNIRMQICKLYADDGINKRWNVERRAPFGELTKTHAEFEIIDDQATGGIDLRKLF